MEAHQIVERAARLLRPHQVHVDLARVRHRLAHPVLGDLVEVDPAHPPVTDRITVLQPAQHLPGDRLALAVRIGGEDQALGICERGPDATQHPARPARRRVGHREAVLGPDRAVLRRQVAHMSHAREHPVAVMNSLFWRSVM